MGVALVSEYVGSVRVLGSSKDMMFEMAWQDMCMNDTSQIRYEVEDKRSHIALCHCSSLLLTFDYGLQEAREAITMLEQSNMNCLGTA